MDNERLHYEALEFALEQAEKRAEFFRGQFVEQRTRAEQLSSQVAALTTERDEANRVIAEHIRAAVNVDRLPAQNQLRIHVALDEGVAMYGGANVGDELAIGAAYKIRGAFTAAKYARAAQRSKSTEETR